MYDGTVIHQCYCNIEFNCKEVKEEAICILWDYEKFFETWTTSDNPILHYQVVYTSINIIFREPMTHLESLLNILSVATGLTTLAQFFLPLECVRLRPIRSWWHSDCDEPKVPVTLPFAWCRDLTLVAQANCAQNPSPFISLVFRIIYKNCNSIIGEVQKWHQMLAMG